MKRLSSSQFLRVAGKVLEDAQPIAVTITISEAWVLVAALQLATRNPGMPSTTRRHVTGIARQFQLTVEQRHPEAHDAFEMGWWERFDR